MGILMPFSSKAQRIEATYVVSKDININLEKFGNKKIASLESIGHLYRKGGRYMYYETPNYLGSYPDGSIKYKVSADEDHYVGICMDSVQRLSYKDMDSLVRIYRPHIDGKARAKFNYRQRFDADFYEWQMIKETKNINGLRCQKAELRIKDNLQWVVWFTGDVPMQAGIGNIIGIPGLVVEADNIPLSTHYKLNSYVVGNEVAEEIFHPREFKQPFTTLADLKKSSVQSPKSKIQKQADLTNQ